MRKLVIVTKKFGGDFTGATLATQYFISNWKDEFDDISVFTLELGVYERNSGLVVNLKKNVNEIYKALLEYKKQNSDYIILGYSDDHIGYVLERAKINYVHTYHGNWPDARWINAEFFLKSFYFIPMYKKTITNASYVINVSEYMNNYTRKFNEKSKVIRNGIDEKSSDGYKINEKSFIMVGNIDARKYRKAIQLSEEIYKMDSSINIDIYGEIIQTSIANKLKKQKNIVLKGKSNQIYYNHYMGLINTSTIENLSISVCEALKSNLPVFCFEVGGLPEVVQNDNTGYCCSSKDFKILAKKLVQYANGKYKLDMKTDFIKEFNWNYASEEYIKVFNKLS